MRSAFSTWAHERTGHSNHVIEMCLAHAVGIDIEKAYRRTDQTPRRLSPDEMARLLVPFGIRPKTVWPPRRSTRDRSVKGYHRKQFEAAWAAYCEGTPAQHGNVKYLVSRTKNAART